MEDIIEEIIEEAYYSTDSIEEVKEVLINKYRETVENY